MQACNRKRLVRQVDAGDRSTRARHRFGEDSAATSDVERPLAGETAATLLDVVESQRVDVVKRLEIASGIPPAMRESAELGELGRIGIDHDASIKRYRTGSLILQAFLPHPRAGGQLETVEQRECAVADETLSRDPHVGHLIAANHVDEVGDRIVTGRVLELSEANGDRIGLLARHERSDGGVETE